MTPLLEPLLRELIGAALRRERQRQERTLAQVASAAGVSMQHLSDVERGRKDPSSELLAAITGALGVTLADLLRTAVPDARPDLRAPPEPVVLDLSAGRRVRRGSSRSVIELRTLPDGPRSPAAYGPTPSGPAAGSRPVELTVLGAA